MTFYDSMYIITSSWIFAFGVLAPTLAVEDSFLFCLSAEDGSYVDGVGKIFVAFSERIRGISGRLMRVTWVTTSH